MLLAARKFALLPEWAEQYGLFWTISHTLIGFTVVFQVHFFFLLVVGLLCVHEFKKHYRYDEYVCTLPYHAMMRMSVSLCGYVYDEHEFCIGFALTGEAISHPLLYDCLTFPLSIIYLLQVHSFD